MEHLSNDHEDHPNEHENSHKPCDEKSVAYPEVNLGTPRARSASMGKSAGGL